MQLKKAIYATLFVAFVMMGTSKAVAQSSSLNAYSPYTFYGIGDINEQGNAVTRAMGGAALGFRNPLYVNAVNPASYSSVRSNSFLSNFDMEGQNVYARTATAKTSNNSFNIRDISMSFPLGKGLGAGVSVSPYSSVGYRVQFYDQDPDVLANIGQMLYAYTGEGDVTQFKAGIGWEPFKGFSIGADVVYLHGNIERSYNAIPTVITGSGGYHTLMGTIQENIDKFFGSVGLQWTPISNVDNVLTIGAIYQMGGRTNGKVVEIVPVNATLAPEINAVEKEYTSDFSLANTYGLGLYYHRTKWSVGLDWKFADWGSRNQGDVSENICFRNTNKVSLGGQYTPNPGDVRNALNRWTYRAGLRWAQNYVVLNDTPISDVALTMGVGIPLRMTGLSNINLGLELGQRGTTNAGLVRENYLKFTIGFSFFGEDYWFMKVKYD